MYEALKDVVVDHHFGPVLMALVFREKIGQLRQRFVRRQKWIRLFGHGRPCLDAPALSLQFHAAEPGRNK